jgi:repressor LexA
MTRPLPTQPTDKQQEVLTWVRQHVAEKGYPPTRREIADHFGFKSSNAAEAHLHGLEAKGFIRITAGTARGIQIVDEATA